jgi:hypothetical protein
MTARVWADTLRQLDSLPLPEAHTCAKLIRAELDKFVPRMTRHSFKTAASESQAAQMSSYSINKIRSEGVNITNIPDEVYLHVDDGKPPFLPDLQNVDAAFSSKENRYSTVGTAARRTMVRAAWNNMAIAELRDLNRHRSGYRFSPLCPRGFYLPEEAKNPNVCELLDEYKKTVEAIAAGDGRQIAAPTNDVDNMGRRVDNRSGAYVYALLLGTQVAFEHSTHLDKFIYEIELRTGMGAHFRYAEHLSKAAALLTRERPELAPFIQTGNAEPEF